MNALGFLSDPKWWSEMFFTVLVGGILWVLVWKGLKATARFAMTATKKNTEYWDSRVSMALREPIELIALQSEMQFYFSLAIMCAVFSAATGVIGILEAQSGYNPYTFLAFHIVLMLSLLVLLILATIRKTAIRRVCEEKMAEISAADEQ